MEHIFGYGSDKKVVHLNYSDTITYLKTQIVDFKHDAGDTYNLPNINIVTMMSKWLHANNSILRDVPYNDFRNNLIKSLAKIPNNIEQMNGLNGGNFISLFKNNGFYVKKLDKVAQDNNVRVVIDQCGPSAGAICNAKGKYAMLTPSVIYDQGAYPQLCGNKQILYCSRSYKTQWGKEDSRKHADGTWRVPHFPTEKFNNYSYSNETIEMSRTITSYKCTKTRSAEKDKFHPQDYYILGQLMNGNGKLVDIILAFRGTIVTQFDDSDFLSFSHRVEEGIIQNRGYSPTNTMLRSLHDVLPSICASPIDRDLLIAYCELMAKHWGDLGLIMDVIGTDYYIVSQDRTIKYLCAILKTNCIFDNYAFTVKPKVPGPYIYDETNTASLFT